MKKTIILITVPLLRLSLKHIFGEYGHGFGGCDGLGGLSLFGGFDGFSGFVGFGGFIF